MRNRPIREANIPVDTNLLMDSVPPSDMVQLAAGTEQLADMLLEELEQ